MCMHVAKFNTQLFFYYHKIADVQPNRVYRFNISSIVYFNAGRRGDVQGQNYRVNMAEFEEGLVVVVKVIDGEFVFSAAVPDMARSIFRKEDQQTLSRM